MANLEKILDFFRQEFLKEERSGFQILSRIPNVSLRDLLAHYGSLSEADRLEYIDCGAHWAAAIYGVEFGLTDFDHTKHPYFRQWSRALSSYRKRTMNRESWRTVPLLRATIQQYKIDRSRGLPATEFETKEFEHAQTVRDLKAPEMRKRVRASLRPIGYQRTDKVGCFCQRNGHDFHVRVDYGGGRGHHQMRYGVIRREICFWKLFAFEPALGFVMGNAWDYIVEENADEVFALLTEVARYSSELPERIREAAG